MDTEQFFKFLAGITEISPGFIQEIETGLTQEFYKSRQIIQAQNQPEPRFWFLEKGFARGYFYDEQGNEHTTRFWHEHEIIFSFTGSWNLPAMEYIEILGDTQLHSISYQQLHQFIIKYPEANTIIKSIIKKAIQQKYKRHSLCSLPAGKRYQQLRKESPEIFKKATLRVIASYLNMTRESLSRIISKEH